MKLRFWIKILYFFIAISIFPNDWYKSQTGTGIGNCGPACVAMAIEWARDIDLEVSYVRRLIGRTEPDGSTNIFQLLYATGRYARCALLEVSDLKDLTFEQNIYIINVDTKEIKNRDYKFEGGHYIVLYGKEFGYFKVNDPLANKPGVYYKISEVKKALKYSIIMVIERREEKE